MLEIKWNYKNAQSKRSQNSFSVFWLSSSIKGGRKGGGERKGKKTDETNSKQVAR